MSNKGQTLLEVLIAATVGILVITALTFATIYSVRNATLAKNSAQATKLAQEGLEKIRTIRDRDSEVNYSGASYFSDLLKATTSLNCPESCYFYFYLGKLSQGAVNRFEEIPPNFKRQFIIENAGNDQKKVTSVVRWTDFSGNHDSRLSTILGKI